MGMVVQHNMSAMNANRNLGITATNLSKSTEKLSSGYKINRAGDNAAGLAISEKMRGQIRGLDQASSNAEDGISMIQTAEGALTETHSILQRMRELAVQASSDTNTDDDRTQIQNEIDQLTQEVDRIATTTEFNTKKLIDGSAKGAVSEKAGKANVDATFANSNVSAEITTDGSAKAAFSDVIRIEITADFEPGKSTASTSKLNEDTLSNIVKLVGTSTAAGAAVTVGGQSIAATGTATTQSTEENLGVALENTNTVINTMEGTVRTSSSAINTNQKAMNTAVKELAALKYSDNSTALADGVTEKDLSDAVAKVVDAYTKSGQTTTATTDATNAQNELKALFRTGTTTITASDAKSVNIVNDTGTADTKTSAGSKTTITAAGGDYADNLIAAAKAMADVNIKDAANKDNLSKLNDFKNALEETDLVKSAINYENVKATNTVGATDSDELKAEKANNIKAAKAELDKLNEAKSVLTVTDLFGNTDDTNKFEVGSKVDDDNNLTITLKNKKGDDTVITISNADKMKAGDVITITAKEMVETEQAPTGKDAFRLQVGANAGQEVMLGINSMKAKDLNIVQTKEGVEGKALDVTNQASASLAVNAYDMAIQSVSTERAKLGATQNRLEHTISNLDTSSENLQSAESSLRDTDMAEEMTRYSKSNILQQAGQSMLAQANQSTQGVLNLLG